MISWRYVNGRASWELNLYDDLADAIKEAAINLNVPICWGAAWAVPEKGYPMDIRKWEGTMEEAMNAYIDYVDLKVNVHLLMGHTLNL